jgi:hypothetical protein
MPNAIRRLPVATAMEQYKAYCGECADSIEIIELTQKCVNALTQRIARDLYLGRLFDFPESRPSAREVNFS